jgi:hypothetical protein
MWLQIVTVFWIGGKITSLGCGMYMAFTILGRQKFMHLSLPLGGWNCYGKAEKLLIAMYWTNSSRNDPCSEKKSEMHNFINSIWNKDELSWQWLAIYYYTVKVKVMLSPYLTKHHAMKTYGEVGV